MRTRMSYGYVTMDAAAATAAAAAAVEH